MLLFSRRRLVVTFFLVVFSTLMLLVVSINIKELDSVKFSIDSQNILFWGIIILLIQFFTFISLYISHKKIIYNIRRVSKIGELSHPMATKILNGMGNLGKEIDQLLRSQNELIELRANRITALNNLVYRLSSEYQDPIIISDVSGEILNYSNNLKDKIDIDSVLISDIIPGLPLESVVTYMQLNKSVWHDDDFKGVYATPIFDRDNKVSFCIWDLNSEIKKFLQPSRILNIQKKSLKNIVGKVFKSK